MVEDRAVFDCGDARRPQDWRARCSRKAPESIRRLFGA